MSAKPNEGLADVDHVTFANMALHGRYRATCPDWRREIVNTFGAPFLSNTLHPALQLRSGVSTPPFNDAETLLARRFASRILEADCMLAFWHKLLFERVGQASEAKQASALQIPIFDFDQELSPEDLRRATEAVDRVREDGAAREARSQEGPDFDFDEVWTEEMFAEYAEFYAQARESTTLNIFGRLRALTSDEIERTKAALLDLASCVIYSSGSYAKDMACETLWYRKTPAGCFLPGAPSVIQISLDELSAHYAAMQGDLISQAWASISLGFKFVQQLAHAALAAAYPGAALSWHNRYNFSITALPGADCRMLEGCVFGGLLRKERDEAQDALKSHYTINGAEGEPGIWFASSDFPSADVSTMCGDVEDEEEAPFFHREWRVPYSWLIFALTDHYWDGVGSSGKMLWPRREMGYVMARDHKRKYGPYHANQLPAGIVPSGFSFLPRSYLIVKNDLYHDAVGAILYGGFTAGNRPQRNVGHPSENGTSVLTDDTSISDASEEEEEDEDDNMSVDVESEAAEEMENPMDEEEG